MCTGEECHALTNAERRRAHRERHLNAGEKTRIQLFVSAHARKQLYQLARHVIP
jgi:hypothetical protein